MLLPNFPDWPTTENEASVVFSSGIAYRRKLLCVEVDLCDSIEGLLELVMTRLPVY
jgi:hypothetical protein